MMMPYKSIILEQIVLWISGNILMILSIWILICIWSQLVKGIRFISLQLRGHRLRNLRKLEYRLWMRIRVNACGNLSNIVRLTSIIVRIRLNHMILCILCIRKLEVWCHRLWLSLWSITWRRKEVGFIISVFGSWFRRKLIRRDQNSAIVFGLRMLLLGNFWLMRGIGLRFNLRISRIRSIPSIMKA